MNGHCTVRLNVQWSQHCIVLSLKIDPRGDTCMYVAQLFVELARERGRWLICNMCVQLVWVFMWRWRFPD